jgi:hypothetical protein
VFSVMYVIIFINIISKFDTYSCFTSSCLYFCNPAIEIFHGEIL